jgi:hypothetical protein
MSDWISKKEKQPPAYKTIRFLIPPDREEEGYYIKPNLYTEMRGFHVGRGIGGEFIPFGMVTAWKEVGLGECSKICV